MAICERCRHEMNLESELKDQLLDHFIAALEFHKSRGIVTLRLSNGLWLAPSNRDGQVRIGVFTNQADARAAAFHSEG